MIKEYDGYYDSKEPSEYSSSESTSVASPPKPVLPASVQKFLDDENVPAALKTLYTDILPAKNLAAFQKLLKTGALDSCLDVPAHPLAGLTSLVIGTFKDDIAQATPWLSAIAHHEAFDAKTLGFTFAYNSRYIYALADDIAGSKAHPVPLASHLFGKLPLEKIAGIHPDLLMQEFKTNDVKQSLLQHGLAGNYVEAIAKLAALEKELGSAKFLFNHIGTTSETLFYRWACNVKHREDEGFLNALSWMLERAPSLIDGRDDFGWTVLDRYIKNTSGSSNTIVHSPLLRLLVSAGAQLHRQLSPDFNLAAEVAKRETLSKDILRVKSPSIPRPKKP